MRLKELSFMGSIFTLEFVGFSNCQVKGGTSEICFGKLFRPLSEDTGTRSREGEGCSRVTPQWGRHPGLPAFRLGCCSVNQLSQSDAVSLAGPESLHFPLIALAFRVWSVLRWTFYWAAQFRLLWTPDLFYLMMYVVASSDVRDKRKETFHSTHHVSFGQM